MARSLVEGTPRLPVAALIRSGLFKAAEAAVVLELAGGVAVHAERDGDAAIQLTWAGDRQRVELGMHRLR